MAVLVATVDGYHILTSSGEHHVALPGRNVAALTPGPAGTWLAIVDDHEIWQHDADGEWQTLASSTLDLTCLVTVAGVVFAGAVGPTVVRLGGDRRLEPLTGFDAVPGRDEWHRVGSALEVRSLSATADGSGLLANIHVGGIVRSEDGGASWQPTIAVDADVHEVRAHPTASDIAVAAAAVGLCASRDGGRHWEMIDEGLHATYARAVVFDGDDVLVSASDGPFANRSAIYRYALDALDGRGAKGRGVVARVGDGLPEWLDGNVNTRCMGGGAGKLALADASGAVWATSPATGDWSRRASGLPSVNAVVVV